MRWVEGVLVLTVITTNPLEQGLKLEEDSANSIDVEVITTNPLEQGLKHENGYSIEAGKQVITTNPLEQGLKLKTLKKQLQEL